MRSGGTRDRKVLDVVPLPLGRVFPQSRPALVEYEAITLYSLGTMLAPYDRNSEEGRAGHIAGMRAAIARGPKLTKRELARCPK